MKASIGKNLGIIGFNPSDVMGRLRLWITIEARELQDGWTTVIVLDNFFPVDQYLDQMTWDTLPRIVKAIMLSTPMTQPELQQLADELCVALLGEDARIVAKSVEEFERDADGFLAACPWCESISCSGH